MNNCSVNIVLLKPLPYEGRWFLSWLQASFAFCLSFSHFARIFLLRVKYGNGELYANRSTPTTSKTPEGTNDHIKDTRRHKGEVKITNNHITGTRRHRVEDQPPPYQMHQEAKVEEKINSHHISNIRSDKVTRRSSTITSKASDVTRQRGDHLPSYLRLQKSQGKEEIICHKISGFRRKAYDWKWYQLPSDVSHQWKQC